MQTAADLRCVLLAVMDFINGTPLSKLEEKVKACISTYICSAFTRICIFSSRWCEDQLPTKDSGVDVRGRSSGLTLAAKPGRHLAILDLQLAVVDGLDRDAGTGFICSLCLVFVFYFFHLLTSIVLILPVVSFSIRHICTFIVHTYTYTFTIL